MLELLEYAYREHREQPSANTNPETSIESGDAGVWQEPTEKQTEQEFGSASLLLGQPAQKIPDDMRKMIEWAEKKKSEMRN